MKSRFLMIAESGNLTVKSPVIFVYAGASRRQSAALYFVQSFAVSRHFYFEPYDEQQFLFLGMIANSFGVPVSSMLGYSVDVVKLAAFIRRYKCIPPASSVVPGSFDSFQQDASSRPSTIC